MINRLSKYWPLLLIILVTGFLLFFRINRDSLRDWDECVYTQYAVEMKNSGNILTNLWNGNLVFEKPPLNTILMQIPFIFGINELTARVLFNLFILGLIIAVYVFCKKYFSNPVAVVACLIVLTSEVIIVYGIRVNTDIGFTLFTFLGFYCWILSTKKNVYIYPAGLLFGLAVLIKGLSIISYLITILFLTFIFYKKEKVINYLKLIIVFLMAIFPWHLYEYLTYGKEFLQIYFIEHLFKRSGNSLDFHFEGRLFYLKLIYKNLFPWILFISSLPILMLFNLKKYFNLKSVIKIIKTHEIIISVLSFIILPILFLSIAKTRIAWYAMPVYPFIAIFLAYSIELLFKKIKLNKLIYIVILLIALDGFKLITKETNFFQTNKVVSKRDDVFIKAGNYPKKQIDYLVWYSERKSKEVLPQSMQTSTTFVYGGNPCAVYYSGKKVNYYYSIPDFQKRVNQKNGLYVIENGDVWAIKDLPIKILYNNNDYTIFEN